MRLIITVLFGILITAPTIQSQTKYVSPPPPSYPMPPPKHGWGGGVGIRILFDFVLYFFCFQPNSGPYVCPPMDKPVFS